MVVFHGSDVVAHPMILTPTRPIDFGVGFYVTENMSLELLMRLCITHTGQSIFDLRY